MACHLPWVGVADGDFPRGFPGGFSRGILPPFSLPFYDLFCGGSVALPSLVPVRVIREEPAPLSGRDVYLRFTLFQVMGPGLPARSGGGASDINNFPARADAPRYTDRRVYEQGP